MLLCCAEKVYEELVLPVLKEGLLLTGNNTVDRIRSSDVGHLMQDSTGDRAHRAVTSCDSPL